MGRTQGQGPQLQGTGFSLAWEAGSVPVTLSRGAGPLASRDARGQALTRETPKTLSVPHIPLPSLQQ